MSMQIINGYQVVVETRKRTIVSIAVEAIKRLYEVNMDYAAVEVIEAIDKPLDDDKILDVIKKYFIIRK